MDGLVDLYDRTSGLLIISEADKARFRNTVYFSQFLEVGGHVWKPGDMSMMFEDFLEDGTTMLLYVDEHTPITEALVGFALVKLKDESCRTHRQCVVCADASEKCLYVEFLAIHPNFQTRRTRGASRLEPFFERIRRFAKSRGYNCMRLTSINIRVAEIYKQHAFVLEQSDESSSAKCLTMKSRLTFGRGRKRRRFFLHFRISKK
jgi:hypothetical protein